MEPYVGCWATLCCKLDLYQVTTQEELDELREWIEEDWAVGIWPTREDALRDLSRAT